MVRSITAALFGAIIVFAWSFVSWMVLPWHNWDMKSFKHGGEAVAAAIRTEASEPGFYVIPNMTASQQVATNEKQWDDKVKSEKEWATKAEKGPFAFINISPTGFKWDFKMTLLNQFIAQLITAFIAVWLLNRSSLIFTFHRALFVALGVSAGVFLCGASNWNWWHFPVTTTVVNIADALIAWFLAGLVMAKIAR